MSFSPISQNVNQNAQNIPIEADLDSLKDSLSELKKRQEHIVAKMTEMSRELEARKIENDNFKEGILENSLSQPKRESYK